MRRSVLGRWEAQGLEETSFRPPSPEKKACEGRQDVDYRLNPANHGSKEAGMENRREQYVRLVLLYT